MKIAKQTLCLIMCLTLALCSAVFAGAAESSVISRVCVTFYGDPGTSAGFSWQTKSDADTDVEVVPAEDGDFSSVNAKSFTGSCELFKDYYSHKAVAKELTPGTEYLYRVGSKVDNDWSSVRSFTTAPGSVKPFSFTAIADVQASSSDGFKRGAVTLAKALELNSDSAFAVNLGDFVNDCTNDEWEWFFEEFDSSLSHTTLVPVAGNHDGNLKWNWFKNQFNLKAGNGCIDLTGQYYSFDYGDAHFAVLNTNDMYPMSQQQINWLINDMTASTAKWKIVFQHRAFYSAGKNINKPDTVIMRDRLLPIIDMLDIDLLMAGHDHMYMRTYQVCDDIIQPTEYITETYAGKEYTFALNPEGTVHILPNTAGGKRYSVHYDAMDPILDCAAKADQPGTSVFTNVRIDGDYLIYQAYTINTDTGETSLYDIYAIKKTAPSPAAEPTELPTGYLENLPRNIINLAFSLGLMTIKYFSILPKVILTAIGG